MRVYLWTSIDGDGSSYYNAELTKREAVAERSFLVRHSCPCGPIVVVNLPDPPKRKATK